jgi:catechol 2,3-dioxygenase-like lactoylglutathione lyase family enzyme
MGMDKWKLLHVGISVRNMDEAVKYFRSLGGKTDDRPAIVLDSRRFKDYWSYGKKDTPPWQIKIKMMELGPLTIEMTEPVSGNNWNEIFLKEYGEGPNHVSFQVDELEKEVAELEAKGVPAMYHAKGEYAYMDARKVGGMVLELFQKRDRPPGAPQ